MSVVELGYFLHPCEDDLVVKCTNEKIPYFNAPLYFENKQQIGKVDEIFGPINDFVSFVRLVNAFLYECYISVVVLWHYVHIVDIISAPRLCPVTNRYSLTSTQTTCQ